MKRPGFQRDKRRHIRLTLEHLEGRRLMAGLNVMVFLDQDGSRSITPIVDTPAANRLVYVDLDRDLRFDDGEPLAVSGLDGIARFPNLTPGDYLVGLASGHPSQVVTTSLTNDTTATLLSPTTGSLGVMQSSDLQHAWSVSTTGRLTPVGPADANRLPINLGAPVLSFISGTSASNSGSGDGELASPTAANGFALLQPEGSAPVLISLDFKGGFARILPVVGTPLGARLTGLARANDGVVLQYVANDQSYVAKGTASLNAFTLEKSHSVPSGQLVSTPVANQFAVLASDTSSSTVTLVQLPTDPNSGDNASTRTVNLTNPANSLAFSSDGSKMFVSLGGSGVNVYSTTGNMSLLAQLADATGPISAASRDGRFVSASAARGNEIIVWDAANWRPTGRIGLPEGQGPLTGLAMDLFGQQTIATTNQGVYTASLSNASPQAVKVLAGRNNETALGVRLVSTPRLLPEQIDVSLTTDEDQPIELNLGSRPELTSQTVAQTMFVGLSNALMGTVQLAPTGRLVYRSVANAFGDDSVRIQVFDGISTSTLVLSIHVRPVNDPPASFSVDAGTISEAALAGEIAGFATVFDVDANASYTITTNDNRFYVEGGQILRSSEGKLDYETEKYVVMDVTATDTEDASISITRRVVIPVFDSNDAPWGVRVPQLEAEENRGGIALGNVTVLDADDHGSYQFSVSDSRFVIENGQLRLMPGAHLDFETESQVELQITVVDPTAFGSTPFVTETVTVDVTDANDAPTGILLSNSSVHARQTGAAVGTIGVIDQDVSDTHTVQVYDERFRVDGMMLMVNYDTVLDSSDPIPVLVTVKDSRGAVFSQTVTVTVVNDAPFQNPNNPLDVDNDGKIYPRDVLILINELNRKGSHVIMPPSGEGDAGTAPVFMDVNGDGMLTPLDALILINHINRQQRSGEGESSQPQSVPAPSPRAWAPSAWAMNVEADGESSESAACEQILPVYGQVDFALFAPPVASPLVLSPFEQIQRDAIDAELEMLVEQLSHQRLR